MSQETTGHPFDSSDKCASCGKSRSEAPFAEPCPGAPKPKVYVVVTGRAREVADVAGVLFDHEGEELWGHVSSGIGWLRRDLTDGFMDRRADLEARYPEGYEVVVVEGPGPAYDEVVALWDAADPDWREKSREDR